MSRPSAPSRRQFLATSASVAIAAGAAQAAEKDKDASRYQIGCYTRPWDGFEYRVALDAIAEAGYRHVGLMTTKSDTRLVISVATPPEEAERIGEECRQRKLSIPSVYGGGIPVGKSLEAGIAGLKRLIDNCAAAGAKNLLMGGIGNEKLYDAYFKAIAACCNYATEKNIGISIKPHGGLNATGPQCRKAIERVGHPNFRIWYDPGNILYYSNGNRDPVKDAATVEGLVVGMCVKDYQHPKQVMITPGTGRVDFPGVLRQLKAGGFTRGALVVECLTRGGQADLVAEAKKTRAFLERLVAKVA